MTVYEKSVLRLLMLIYKAILYGKDATTSMDGLVIYNIEKEISGKSI